jgi:hypothetical protein
VNSVVLGCMLLATACNSAETRKVSEAERRLEKIEKRAKTVFTEGRAFPIGTAKTLPESPNPNMKGCCGGKSGGNQVDNRCPVTTEWANDPVWMALGFSLDEPSNYRYTYQSSDGKSFTATAVGDLDCDMQEATFTLTGKLDESGNPTIDLKKPPPDVF